MKLLTKIAIAALILGTGFAVGRVYLLYPLLSVDHSFPQQIFNRAFLSFYARIIGEFIAVTLLIFGLLWIWWRQSDWVLRSLLLSALLVFGWRCTVLHREAITPFMRFSLQSSIEGQAQFFYYKGRNFNETDSQRAGVGSRSRYQDCEFPLPRSATIYAFRFDPLMGSGTIRIREMAIVNGLGHIVLAIDLGLWRAAQQIRVLTIQNHELLMVTEMNADDPQLILELSSPLVLNWSRSFMTDAFLGRVLLECLIIGILTALALVAMKIHVQSSSLQPKVGTLWDMLFLLVSLFLLQVYARGKWEDTIGFFRAWFYS